jgi:hypothetical protein
MDNKSQVYAGDGRVNLGRVAGLWAEWLQF